MTEEFCSLNEAMKMLKKSNSEVVMGLVQQHKLKNYGSDEEPMFKIGDVENLLKAESPVEPKPADAPDAAVAKLEDEPGTTIGPAEGEAEPLLDAAELEELGGSGSGLLDLSLQADDSTLGQVMEEIYTADQEVQQREVEGEIPADIGELEQDVEAVVVAPEKEPVPVSVVSRRDAAEPCSASNWIMVICLAVLICAFVIVVAGSRGVSTGLQELIGKRIWWIVLMAVVLVAFFGWAYDPIMAKFGPILVKKFPARPKKINKKVVEVVAVSRPKKAKTRSFSELFQGWLVFLKAILSKKSRRTKAGVV